MLAVLPLLTVQSDAGKSCDGQLLRTGAVFGKLADSVGNVV